MSSISGGIDGVEVRFDEGSLVGDAGLLLAGTVMDRLGLEAMLDEVVRPPGSGRGSGAKALSLVASMLVGGSFIDDADRLRAGSTAQVLPFRPVAPKRWAYGVWRVHQKGLLFCDDCDVDIHVRLKNRRHFLCLDHCTGWTVWQRPLTMRALSRTRV